MNGEKQMSWVIEAQLANSKVVNSLEVKTRDIARVTPITDNRNFNPRKIRKVVRKAA